MFRVAVVQIDYNPACIIREKNLLEEASFYKEGRESLISLEIPPDEYGEVLTFRQKILTSYLRMFEQKIDYILSFLQKKNVKLVLFPEYSIPPPLFTLLNEYAKKGMVIVAGTHTASGEYQEYYKKVRIRPEEGKNICVVFLPNGEVNWIEKLSPFEWEEKVMKLGNKWELLNINGECRFAVFISCDFVNTSHENRAKYAKVEDYLAADFFCIPSFSVGAEKFNEEVRKRAEKIKKALLYANTSLDGASTIFAPFKESLYIKREKALAKGEEGIIIADIDIKATFAKPLSREVAVIPIIYEGTIPHLNEFRRHYASAKDIEEKRKIIEKWEECLFDWWKRKGRMCTFGKKVEIMLCDYKKIEKEEVLDFFTEALVIPKGIPQIDEWRFAMMGEAIKFLQQFLKTTKMKKKIEEIIISYKRQQQILKYRVREEYLEHYYLHKKRIQKYPPMKVVKHGWFYKRWGEEHLENPMDRLIYRPLLSKEEIEQCYILTEKMNDFLKEFKDTHYIFVSPPSTGKTSLLSYLSSILAQKGKEVIWIIGEAPSVERIAVKDSGRGCVLVFDDIDKNPESIHFIEEFLSKFPYSQILCSATKRPPSLPKEFNEFHLPGYLSKKDIEKLPLKDEAKKLIEEECTFADAVFLYKKGEKINYETIYKELNDEARFCLKLIAWADGIEISIFFSLLQKAGIEKEVLEPLIKEGLIYKDICYQIAPDLKKKKILKIPSAFAELLLSKHYTLKYEKEYVFPRLLLDVGTVDALMMLFPRFNQLSEREKAQYIDVLSGRKEEVEALWLLSCLCSERPQLLKFADYVKEKLKDTKDGGHARMLLNFAVAYQRDGQPHKCLEYLKQAVSLYEKDPLLWYNMGTILGILEKVDEQISCYLKAANLGMDDPLLWYGLAVAYGEKKDLEKEIKCYKRCVTLDPYSATAWYNLGLALGKKGEEEEEMECYKKAISINPQDPFIWYNLGLLYGKKGEIDSQIKCYEKALEYDPDDALVWYNLGSLYGKRGEKEKQMRCYAKAVEIEPEYDVAWYNLGVLYGQMNEIEKEMRCYERAIQINPEDAKTWYNLGIVCGKKGKIEEEIRCYESAIKIEPDYEKAWFNLGVVYQDRKQLDKAIECYKNAISINPDDPKAWQNLGFCYRDKGETEEAMKCFERARRLRSKD